MRNIDFKGEYLFVDFIFKLFLSKLPKSNYLVQDGTKAVKDTSFCFFADTSPYELLTCMLNDEKKYSIITVADNQEYLNVTLILFFNTFRREHSQFSRFLISESALAKEKKWYILQQIYKIDCFCRKTKQSNK